MPGLQTIALRNFLSFRDHELPTPLMPLNVLIGPNGSGKSNFVEAFSVLRAAVSDVQRPIIEGGGTDAWLHRGPSGASQFALAVNLSGPKPIHYALFLGRSAEHPIAVSERVTDGTKTLFSWEDGRPVLARPDNQGAFHPTQFDATQSVLAQRRDPDLYPELALVADTLSSIRIYRRWTFGPDNPLRQSSRVDDRSDHLSEALDNLPTRLAVLKKDGPTKRRLIEELNALSPGFTDLEVVPEGGRLQLYVLDGDHSIPATRLSDGTLRYLALLAILLDPTPSPITIIEEPELGFHFDTLSTVAKLLVEASERTQLIITTHSDILLDALQDDPERIVVCEKHDGATTLRRLDSAQLAAWREDYSLGTLWTRGDIGGTRW